MGDIVVGDIGDIDQPQCHMCTMKQKNIVKEKKEGHLWHCGWPMSQCHQPQCHQSATQKILQIATWIWKCVNLHYIKFMLVSQIWLD